jgi:pantetheine-phosphate adenylyltransferase
VYDLPKKRMLFDLEQRLAMTRRALKDYENIRVAPFSGLVVNYAQSVEAMAIVRGLRVFSDFEFEFRYAIANKKLAPEIETVAIMTDERHLHISSTTVREVAELDGDVSSFVPPFVQEALKARFAELRENGNNPGYTMSIRD